MSARPLLRTPLARVRGLGSAKEGTHHFWMQRVTAVALVPLSLWFVLSAIGWIGADYASATEALRSPWSAGLMIMFLAALFHHAQLGLQVVVEDYVHHEFRKLAAVIAIKLAAVLLALVAVLAVLKVSLGAGTP